MTRYADTVLSHCTFVLRLKFNRWNLIWSSRYFHWRALLGQLLAWVIVKEFDAFTDFSMDVVLMRAFQWSQTFFFLLFFLIGLTLTILGNDMRKVELLVLLSTFLTFFAILSLFSSSYRFFFRFVSYGFLRFLAHHIFLRSFSLLSFWPLIQLLILHVDFFYWDCFSFLGEFFVYDGCDRIIILYLHIWEATMWLNICSWKCLIFSFLRVFIWAIF